MPAAGTRSHAERRHRRDRRARAAGQPIASSKADAPRASLRRERPAAALLQLQRDAGQPGERQRHQPPAAARSSPSRECRICALPRRRERHVFDLRPPHRPRHLAAAALDSSRRLRALRAHRQPGVPVGPHRQARRQGLGRPARPRHDDRHRQEGGARRRDRPARHAARGHRRPQQGRAHRAHHEPRQQHSPISSSTTWSPTAAPSCSARSSPSSGAMRAAPTASPSCRSAPASRSS